MSLSPTPLSTAEDRVLRVSPGTIVRTAWISVFACRLANRERMAIGDIDRAYQRRLQAGADNPFPCPNGAWSGGTFVIFDGRHEWIAAVALGHDQILVAWTEAF